MFTCLCVSKQSHYATIHPSQSAQPFLCGQVQKLLATVTIAGIKEMANSA